MNRTAKKVIAYAAATVVTIGAVAMPAEATSSVTSVLPSVGIEYELGINSTSLSDVAQAAESKKSENKKTEEKVVAEVGPLTASVGETVLTAGKKAETTEEETSSGKNGKEIIDTVIVSKGYTQDLAAATGSELTDEEEGFKNLVIANVNDYVNVRDLPSEVDGQIIGKLYDDSVGTFIEEVDGWYKISSGSVEGYVKGEYCVTGDEAVELAKQVGTRIATVTTTTLKVREEPGLDATVLGLVPIEDQLIVSEELDGWVKVDIEEGFGYVSTDYVTLSTEFVKAESKAEEEARLAKEKAEREAAQKAAAARNNAGSGKSSGSNYTDTGNYAPAGSGTGANVAAFACQFVGNPYVYGGTSLTNGADCSGFVMSVYKNFGVNLPHSSAADRSVGSTVGSLAEAQPGDLICYSGHVALYIGNGQIVHASTSKTGIIISNAAYRNILSIRRIF